MGFAQLTTVEASEHESIQRNAHRTLLACQRAKELVRQILTFGRKSERKREPVALYELVTDETLGNRRSLPYYSRCLSAAHGLVQAGGSLLPV